MSWLKWFAKGFHKSPPGPTRIQRNLYAYGPQINISRDIKIIMDPVLDSHRSPRVLADLVQAKLPPELRNLVYSFLWDDKVIKAMDYENLLTQTSKCEDLLGDISNRHCYCDRQDDIPDFTRAISVGHQFAHEAIFWLYENFDGFTINAPTMREFLETDVFHIGFSPASPLLVHVRRLALHMDLDLNADSTQQTSENFSQLGDQISLLYDRPLRHCFRLEIALRIHGIYSPRAIHSLATGLEVLAPTIATLEHVHKAKVDFYYVQQDVFKVSVSHMLGPIEEDKWIHFIHHDLASKKWPWTSTSQHAARRINNCLLKIQYEFQLACVEQRLVEARLRRQQAQRAYDILSQKSVTAGLMARAWEQTAKTGERQRDDHTQ
jgi:hypothetical protein